MSEAELFPVDGLERSFHPWIPHSKRARDEHQEAEVSSSADTQSKYASGRKQACSRCAKRRRKCDSQIPSCSTCRKAKVRCEYLSVNPGTKSASRSGRTAVEASPPEGLESHNHLINTETHPNQEQLDPLFPPNDVSSSLQNGPPLDFDFNDAFFMQPYMWPTVSFSFDNWAQDNEHDTGIGALGASDQIDANYTNNGSSILMDSERTGEGSLDLATIWELLDIFFRLYHKYLPCLHRKSIYAFTESRGIEALRCPLILALLSVASRSHPVKATSDKRHDWHHQAKTLWHSTLASTDNPTRSLQAAVWILFADITSAEIHESWLFLGTASRYASMIGADRLDCSNRANLPKGFIGPNDQLDLEERRRSMWALYLIDRNLSSLCGMPLAIDDRMFNVNFPVEERAFQDSKDHNQASPRKFTAELTALIGPSTFIDDPQPSLYELVLRAVVLLGQITLYHGLHQVGQSERDWSEASDRIESALARFSLALSRFDVTTVDIEDIDYAVWLHVTVQTCIVLFYHPKVSQCLLTGDRGVPKTFSALPPSLQRSANAVESLVRLIKDTTPRSTEALLRPFFLGAFFLCCRFKLIMWKTFRTPKDRDDLDMVIMLIDEFSAKWGLLGQKYQDKMKRDLKTVEDELQDGN